jgi:hypothetical protein
MATRNIPAPSNPYASGAVIFDSTPYTEFYIKEQQKEQAKDEALDKYFMDWDKSINPAGMRNVDTQDFLNLMNENKGFFFKNKAAIKNPALDNGAAYNEWFSRNKSAMGLVAQSKEIASKEEQINKAILQAKQKGLPITDRVVADLEVFRQPIKSKNWRDFNPDNLDFEPKPFDPIRFTKDIFSDIKFDERLQSETKVPETKTIRRVYETAMPEQALSSVYSRAASSYKTSPSVKEFVDMTIQNPVEYKKLNELFTSKYKRPIESSEDAAAAIALSFSPVGKQREQVVDDRLAMFEVAEAGRNRRNAISAANRGSGADFVTSGNIIDEIDLGETEIGQGKKVIISQGEVFNSDKTPYNGQIFITRNKLPASLYSALKVMGTDDLFLKGNKGFTAKIVDGQIESLSDERIGNVDRRFLENAQLKLNTEPQKGRQMQFGGNKQQPKQKEVKETKTFVFPKGKTKF